MREELYDIILRLRRAQYERNWNAITILELRLLDFCDKYHPKGGE